jgi:uncharacterized protein (DUF952 family)
MDAMLPQLLYKVLRDAEWRETQAQGALTGVTVDVRDGFIHLSTREQLAQTLERHFAGETGLVVLEVAAARLGAGLKWEASRGGALFPHLYGTLSMDAVVRTLSAADVK